MKEHKWVKRLVILLVVAVLIIFFGSVFFNLSAYVFDFFKLLSGWFATALRWLGQLFDFFGFAGVFTVHAEVEVVSHILSNIKILMLGG